MCTKIICVMREGTTYIMLLLDHNINTVYEGVSGAVSKSEDDIAELNLRRYVK